MEQDEERLKNAFSRVKDEISRIQFQLDSLSKEVAEIKRALSEAILKNNYKGDYSARRNKYGYNGLSRKFFN